MENPAEYVLIGTKTIWALVGGSSAITLIGVWLLARFTTTFDAYAGERAKIEAQFRNVEKLVANTEKLTAATETIKAKVTDETWDRQQRWNLKKEVYVELSKAIMRLGYKMTVLEGCLKQNDPPNVDMTAKIIAETNDYLECLRILMETIAIAGLVSSKDAAETLQYVFSDIPVPQTLTPDVLNSHRKAMVKTASRFTEFAKKDLGFTVTTDR